MKFDFVIGNPPYQDSIDVDSENRTFMAPVYNLFMDASYQVSEHVELIHPARFLFNAGQTPKAWNEKMLSDPHFKILEYEIDASRIFPNTYINGGVAISYYSKEKYFGGISVFTQFDDLNSILHKTKTKNHIDAIVYNQNKFNLDFLYKEYPEFISIIGSEGKDKRFRNNIFEKIHLFSDKKVNHDDIRVIGVTKAKRVWKYFPRRLIDSCHENLFYWKVLLSSADGAAGTVGNPIPARVLGEPFLSAPNEAYTQTFVGIGSFSTEGEAHAALKYLKTRFCRTLVGVAKITQHITPEVFKYVPLQNFTPSSDIDWSQSVAQIDQQLYRKYGLTDEEIDFIETHVKEMQ